MRCAIGPPMVTDIGTTLSSFRSAARNSSFDREPGRNRTSISAALTSWACSSSSARPVRRAVETTSGKDMRIFSTRWPRRSDSSSEVPGNVTAATVNAPSLNSGRNVRPRNGASAITIASNAPAVTTTMDGRRTTAASNGR
jgi:hypothetical protein